MYFLALATAWHYSNWNLTSVLTVLLFAVTFGGVSRVLCEALVVLLLATCSLLNLDFIRDKLISHGYQWRRTARNGHSRVWEEHSLKSDDDLEKKIPSPPYHLFPPMYCTSLITSHLSEEAQCVEGLPSHHWDWQERSHLITLTGIWEVSAIKWSGAIK